MEHIVFLIEDTHERLSCLLNPESLVVRRVAGLRPRILDAGPLTAAHLSDDPLLYSGGGRTELEVDLLFDVALAGSSIATGDVRELTAPLWALAENRAAGRGPRSDVTQPPLVRLIWGKAWNIPVAVVAVSERLEQFTAGGVPRRSWLRMGLRRVPEPAIEELRQGTRVPEMQRAGAEGGEQMHDMLGSPGRAVEGEDAALDAMEASDLAAEAHERTLAEILATMQDTLSPALDSAFAVLDQMDLDMEAEAEPEEAEPEPGEPAVSEREAARERVRSALGQVASTLSALWTEARERVPGAFARAGRTLGEALSTAREALRALGRGAGEQLQDMCASLGRAVDRMGAAAQDIKNATVRAARRLVIRARDMLAAARDGLGAGLATIESALAVVGDAASAAATRARAEIVDLVAAVREHIGRIRERGADAFAAIRDRLQQLAARVGVLARAGYRACAQLIDKTLAAMGTAAHNALAAMAAMSEVIYERGLELYRRGSEALRQALAKDEPDRVQAALDIVREAADAAAREHAPALSRPVVQAVAQLEDAADRPDDARAVLDDLDRLFAALEAPGKEAVAALVAEAAAAGEILHRRQPGERLDQLAYRYYGDPARWRRLAEHNDIDDPLDFTAREPLRIPGGT